MGEEECYKILEVKICTLRWTWLDWTHLISHEISLLVLSLDYINRNRNRNRYLGNAQILVCKFDMGFPCSLHSKLPYMQWTIIFQMS